jgi:hypothetical protein
MVAVGDLEAVPQGLVEAVPLRSAVEELLSEALTLTVALLETQSDAEGEALNDCDAVTEATGEGELLALAQPELEEQGE